MNYDSQVEVELDNISYQLLAEMTYVRPFFFNFTVTIHKKDFCLREKYPETWNCLPNPEFSPGAKFGLPFEIETTASKWKQFFILSNFCSAAAVDEKHRRKDENKNIALRSCVILAWISDVLKIDKKNKKL